jgi:hypothetical protein
MQEEYKNMATKSFDVRVHTVHKVQSPILFYIYFLFDGNTYRKLIQINVGKLFNRCLRIKRENGRPLVLNRVEAVVLCFPHSFFLSLSLCIYFLLMSLSFSLFLTFFLFLCFVFLSVSLFFLSVLCLCVFLYLLFTYTSPSPPISPYQFCFFSFPSFLSCGCNETVAYP